MGAKVEIETMPGYLPTIPVDAPEELVEAAKLAAGDKYNVNVVDVGCGQFLDLMSKYVRRKK